MDYPIKGYVVMEILSVVGDLVQQNWEDETLSIRTSGYVCYAPEWCSFVSLGPPHPITHEELIVTYNIPPVSVWIKYDFITIPHLRWDRLDVL